MYRREAIRSAKTHPILKNVPPKLFNRLVNRDRLFMYLSSLVKIEYDEGVTKLALSESKTSPRIE